MSDRNSTCSAARPAGTLIGPTSANGTRRYSAWTPGKPPSMWQYPNRPDGDWPITLAAIPALGFDRSHSENSFLSQKTHSPQAMLNGTTTRAPTFSRAFADQTSTNSHLVSSPSTSTDLMAGM